MLFELNNIYKGYCLNFRKDYKPEKKIYKFWFINVGSMGKILINVYFMFPFVINPCTSISAHCIFYWRIGVNNNFDSLIALSCTGIYEYRRKHFLFFCEPKKGEKNDKNQILPTLFLVFIRCFFLVFSLNRPAWK